VTDCRTTWTGRDSSVLAGVSRHHCCVLRAKHHGSHQCVCGDRRLSETDDGAGAPPAPQAGRGEPTPAPSSPHTLAEQGRQLASRREDLIAEGVDPAHLVSPLHPGAAWWATKLAKSRAQARARTRSGPWDNHIHVKCAKKSGSWSLRADTTEVAG
jgi:hypothetical protein